MNYMKKIYQPEIYQGRDKPSSYFEGWYLKHVSADQAHRLVVIPGISLSAEDPHAFIQIITGTPLKVYYIRYDIDSFIYSKDSFDISIDNNHFGLEGITLDIDRDDLTLIVDLQYGDISRIDRTFLTPNIMGFFAYFNFMQCNHGVISLDHELSGNMILDGQTHHFDRGKGYIEKDWGTSFPKKYIWLQCNHFNEDVSLFASIAHVPFLKTSFLGFIVILCIGEQQFRFATYNGSKITLNEHTDNTLTVIFEHNKYILEISATMENGMMLKAPYQGVMTNEIAETLDGTLDISLYQENSCLLTAKGTSAAIEVVDW